MVDKDCVFVLGAQDPEMREIAHVLRTLKRGYLHAAKERMRVNSRTAYDADGVAKVMRGGRAAGAVLPPRDPAAFVECTVRGHEPLLRIDHHNPGDPGYPMPPERYLEGASIGQTLHLLEMEPQRRRGCSLRRIIALPRHIRVNARRWIRKSSSSCARRGARRSPAAA